MIVLGVRTDKPEAEVYIVEKEAVVAHKTWLAHRALAETLHQTIFELLKRHSLDWDSIDAIVCYQGPGSFTGLRIGLTVGNSLAYGLSVPIVATTGGDWLHKGLQLLADGKGQTAVMPSYGAPVHITLPKK